MIPEDLLSFFSPVISEKEKRKKAKCHEHSVTQLYKSYTDRIISRWEEMNRKSGRNRRNMSLY